MNDFSCNVLQNLNGIDTFQELQLAQSPCLIGHYRTPYIHTPVLEMWVLQLYCTYSAHFFQLTSVHTGDENTQKFKCHFSPQKCGSLCTVPQTVKLGAALSREPLAASYHFRCISLFSLFQILMILSYLMTTHLFSCLVFLPKIFMVIHRWLFIPTDIYHWCHQFVGLVWGVLFVLLVVFFVGFWIFFF